MKISVIVPSYVRDETEKDLLERCIRSIDKRFDIQLVSDTFPFGVSWARNVGLERAFDGKPDYITFLDADDTMNPDAWEQMTKAIAEEPDEPVIQMNHLRKKDGTVYSRFYNRRGTYYPDRLPQFWFVVWNKVFKTEFLEGIRFIEGFQHGEDELFVLNCLAKSRRIYCSERIAVTHHFDNKGSLSNNVTPSDLIEEQTALLEYLGKHREDRELCKAVRIRQAELWNNDAYKNTF